MLLLPRRADQRFNAFCITTLAAGAAMKPELLAAEDMTRMLAERLLTTECKNRAGIVSDDLRGVDGLEQACDLIERAL
jgi:UDP:flavonoid glycosyltransferase YjiC (YdhE family)